MHKAKTLWVLTPLCSLVLMSVCYGAPTIDANGRAMGIPGLDVGGVLYDVQFRIMDFLTQEPEIVAQPFWGDLPGALSALSAVASELNSFSFPAPEVADPSGALPQLQYIVIPTSTMVFSSGAVGLYYAFTALGYTVPGIWLDPPSPGGSMDYELPTYTTAMFSPAAPPPCGHPSPRCCFVRRYRCGPG